MKKAIITIISAIIIFPLGAVADEGKTQNNPSSIVTGNQITDLQRPIKCYYDAVQLEKFKPCKTFSSISKISQSGVCIYVSVANTGLKQKVGWHWGNWNAKKTGANRFVSRFACINGVDVVNKDPGDTQIGPSIATVKKVGTKYIVYSETASKQLEDAEKLSGLSGDHPLLGPTVCYKTVIKGMPASPKECQYLNSTGIDYCAPKNYTTGNYLGEWWAITTNTKGTTFAICKGGVDLAPYEPPQLTWAWAGYQVRTAEGQLPLACWTSATTFKACNQASCVEKKITPPVSTETATDTSTPVNCAALEGTCEDTTLEILVFSQVGANCKCKHYNKKFTFKSGCCWDHPSGNGSYVRYKTATTYDTCVYPNQTGLQIE